MACVRRSNFTRLFFKSLPFLLPPLKRKALHTSWDATCITLLGVSPGTVRPLRCTVLHSCTAPGGKARFCNRYLNVVAHGVPVPASFTCCGDLCQSHSSAGLTEMPCAWFLCLALWSTCRSSSVCLSSCPAAMIGGFITKYLSTASMNSCHCVWLMRHYLKCLLLFFF